MALSPDLSLSSNGIWAVLNLPSRWISFFISKCKWNKYGFVVTLGFYTDNTVLNVLLLLVPEFFKEISIFVWKYIKAPLPENGCFHMRKEAWAHWRI